MDIVGLVAALILPWLAGIAWVHNLWPKGPGRWPAVLGYGYLLGFLATTLLMRLWDALGLTQHFWGMALIILGIGLFGLWGVGTFGSPRVGGAAHPATPAPESSWVWILSSFVVALILVRYGGYALEILWRPLYPWDAWSGWADRARVWFEHKELVTFGGRWRWLEGAPGTVFVGGTGHPPTISLVQTWSALGLARWHDSVINLPWLGCAAALGLGLYGQALMMGIRRLPALLLIYVILSMPILGAHVALAGYADLWLTTCYALAAAALLRWIWQRDMRQGLLALLLALACPLIKADSGLLWMAILLFAGLISLLRPTGLWVLAGLAVGLAAGMALGINLALPGVGEMRLSFEQIRIPGLAEVELAYHGIWGDLAKYWFQYPAWHLAFYIFLGGLLVVFCRSQPDVRVVGTGALVIASVGSVVAVFVGTEYHMQAVEGTTVNRAVLPAAVMGLFALAVWSYTNRGAAGPTDERKGDWPDQRSPGLSDRELPPWQWGQ